MPRIAEDHLIRACQESRIRLLRQFPVRERAGVGHARVSLQPNRQQRMRLPSTGPVLLVRTEKPDSVGCLTGGLKRLRDQHLSIAGFNGKDGRFDCVRERRNKIRPLDL